MLDCQVALGENAIVRHFAGDSPQRLGARHPSVAPFDAFPVKNGHITIAVGDDRGFRKLCKLLGCPHLGDRTEYQSNALRLRHHEQLKADLSAALATRTAAEWVPILREGGLPCGPINDLADVVADPQVAARNMIVEVEDPTAGTVKVFGCPIKISGVPDPPQRPTAPDLDADRARILRELADGDES
jgi:CoA:oxalate CoA-transferase